MCARKAILIANPKTGRYGSSRKEPIEDLATYLRNLGLTVDLKLTTGPGNATEIAARAAQNGTTDVIVAGGDGTINEAIQGLAGAKARLAIIPRGTANVLARELNLPLDERQSLDVIARGESRRIHLGLAIDEESNTKRYFVLMAGIGLDAAVVKRVQPALKKRLGRGAFWLSGFSHLASWNLEPFQLEIDGQTYDSTFAIIGKAARYGSDLAITPRAQIDQPDFEVCIIDTFSRFRYLQLLSHAMRDGMPLNKRGVRFVRTSRVRATGNAAVQVDGEVVGDLPMTFEIAPFSMDVVVP
jgi:diacylglycerol kinase (ATP)